MAYTSDGGYAKRSYAAHEIDFVATYILPEDTWYIIPVAAVAGRQSLTFCPREPDQARQWEPYREAWHLLEEAKS